MVPNILTTKLQVPRLCAHFITRPRLIEQIDLGLAQQLTLILAPAGFGKTMLLADWAMRQPQPVSWISLDSSENQPTAFWRYVIAALDLLLPGLGATLLPLLESGSDPPLPTILTETINEIVQVSFPIFVILDNYHSIVNQYIHQQVAYLLENCPSNLHLFLLGRTAPPLALPRLRARGQVSEIRSEHLRFQREEIRRFLSTSYSLQLTHEHLATLYVATEGWVDGLHMVAIWLCRLNPTQLQQAFAQLAINNRYVEEYLTAEIFDQQSASRQQFLLYTSILDTLSGPLCRAVTGEEHAQVLLEELEEENLFITALDPMRDRYRYHGMFSDFLRHRLAQTQPDQIAELHQRASLWYEQHGLLTEAVQHAFAAHDWTRALRLTELTAELMTLQERFAAVQKYLEQYPEQLAEAGTENQQLTAILTQQPFIQHNLNALALGRIYLELGHASEAIKVLLGVNLAEPAFHDAQTKFTLITALLEARLQQGKLRLAAATYQPFLSLALTQPQNLLRLRWQTTTARAVAT